ncbi:putative FeS-containing Cyanobacterial-specific oxidoreductase [Mediterraneibacter gnavus ATCC 29149]|jgi:putative radical SAM enzyme (TIGR03279 family)|nr:putative FeS-containing Cyanobacterial-specific oxidoreductase [Mediterraneibacter gnavus ATCC 29149]
MSRQELCFGKKQETKSKNRRSTRSLKMKKHEHIVKSLMPGGIGEELGIEPGDKLLAINGNEIQDVFDYYYYEESEQLLLLIEKPDGEEWELEIEKDEDESLGIEFDQSLMDEYRSCRNKCMFCFIDQMPKGMRETLYFKDDDSRLSFLQGNYITLTNMSDHDVERIVKYRLEPINISFQTTNPELRCKMLHNRFAGEALKKVDILYRGQIEMNGQIVLCKGVNDGEELERTIRDLTGYLPYLKSVSIVPVGLTKYRDGLYPLEPFTKEDAREVLSVIHRWQEKIYQEHGIHMIHAGDEWYVLAEEEVPEEARYDGYLQLENGVGMMRLLFNEVQEALSAVTGDGRQREISLATGRLMYPYIGKILEEIRKKFPNITTHLYAIRNDFFGERITVSGLITGQDLTGQLKGQPLGERLLLPCNMLKIGEPVFLDDFTLEEVENSLQVKTDIVKSSGQDLLDAVIGVYENDDFSTDRRRGRFQEM